MCSNSCCFEEGKPTLSPIAPNHPSYAGDTPIASRADVAAACRLLAQAGHGRGLKVPTIVPVGGHYWNSSA